jgi:hydrogenase-4 component E
MIILILTDFVLLGSSRLRMCIRVVAVQGILLGILPLLMQADGLSIHAALLAAGMILIKGVVFPLLLIKALEETNTPREIEPYIGYIPSLFIGLMALGLSVWLVSRLSLPREPLSAIGMPAAMLTLLCGFFIIVSRRKALTQVLGYLTLENGIYAFGVLFVLEEPLLVELSVLLDVLVGVFLMGVITFHISRTFDHIDIDRLASLHDLTQNHKVALLKDGRS